MIWLAATLAAAPAPPAAAAGDDAPAVDQQVEGLRAAVHETTREFAEAIDDFFGDPEYEEERNETSLTLKLGAEYLSKNGWNVTAQPRLRLRLPKTQRAVLVEIAGERSTSDSTLSTFSEDELGDFSEENLTGFELRLRIFGDLGDVRLTPEIGTGFDDFIPTPFIGVRASRDWRLSEQWLLYGSQRVRLRSDRGFETNTVLRASRPVNLVKDDLLRVSFDFDWRADEPGVSYGPGLSLFAPVGDESALALETGVRLETDPEHQVDAAFGTIRYRRKVLYDWWTMEIAPRVEFREEHDYEASYGGRVRLELDF